MFVSKPPQETPFLDSRVPSVAWWRWFVSISTFLQRLTLDVTLDFPNTTGQQSSDLTVAVPGAGRDGFNFVELGVPAAAVMSGSNYTAWVSNLDEVTVRFNNYSPGAENPPSALFQIRVTRN